MKEQIEKLHLKYETLVNYANERQNHYIKQAYEAEQRYKETGEIEYYQESEGNKNLSARLAAEVRVYRKFKNELEEVLNNAKASND